MKIIKIDNPNIDLLLYNKEILPCSKDNIYWHASIFPKSTAINKLPNKDNNRIITTISDDLFSDFQILTKSEQIVYLDNNTKRDFIKSIEIGDNTDSIKRYINLNVSLDYNTDAKTFLDSNIVDNYDQLNIGKDLIYPTDINISKKPNKSMFDKLSNSHPHINIPTNTYDPKYNDLLLIKSILSWAKDKGIKYIYCINEYRPYIINTNYVTSYVYYTIKGF